MTYKPSKSATQDELVAAITAAARRAFKRLFEEHPDESFYYCSLITTGEALPPAIAAWSWQALERVCRDTGERAEDLKWSYADSPYYAFGDELFSQVRELYASRPEALSTDDESWFEEYNTRLDAMEASMHQLDREGLFGTGKERLKKVVLAEVMPPNCSNTERAKRLNPTEALKEWLREAAEAEDESGR